MIVLSGSDLEHREIEPRLRGLDRHLVTARRAELAQERVAARAVVDQRRVPEADVDSDRPVDAGDRLVERLDAELPRGLRPRLHVGLVDLDDVGAGGEQVDDLVADGAARTRLASASGAP